LWGLLDQWKRFVAVPVLAQSRQWLHGGAFCVESLRAVFWGMFLVAVIIPEV
jgi:hypothetical protein